MLRTDLPDHRRATEEQLVTALRNHDPLALAEAYHRTIPAAHATARRLLSGSAEVEALLREVYAELWASPPTNAALEGWIRARCFALAAEDLRERDAAPASPSLTALLPELPRPEVRYLDAAERALAELDDVQRRSLLLAHDKGVPTEEQNVGDAGPALVAAMLVLAGPEPGNDTPDPQACTDVPLIADWVLGLLPPARAAGVAADVGARPECNTLAKALRRGRRRLEGLPPTPDMGQRVLVTVLSGSPAPVATVAPAPVAAAAPAAVGAGPLPSALDDTGELSGPIVASAVATTTRNDPYAELAELDERPDGEVLDRGEADGEPASDTPDDDADADDDDYGQDMPYAVYPTRSRGSRVLVWVLGTLFMLAGVIAGLYLGLTLWS